MKGRRYNIRIIPALIVLVCTWPCPVDVLAQYRKDVGMDSRLACEKIADENIKIWTLEDCIDYALKHNIDIKRQEIDVLVKKENLSKAKWNYAPSFSAGSTYSISSGRVLDETTYDFVENETVGSSNTSISGSTDLFNGFRKYRELQKARLDLKAGLSDMEIARYDLRANITAAYLEVLCSRESIAETGQIVAMLEIQAEKTEIKARNGKVTEADYLQILSLLYSARNDAISARNNYDMARLELCQLLEIDDFSSFEVPGPESVQALVPDYINGPEQSSSFSDMNDIICRRPEVKSAQINVDISRKNLQIANSSYWPSISLSAGYGSSYSDARQKILQNPDGTFRYEAYPFFRQYADNISIPILSGLSVRKNVRIARLSIADADYALASAKKEAMKELMRLRIDARTAQEKYDVAQEQARYAEEAARQITAKYENGAADVVAYSTAISELATARYNVLAAKYEIIFKNRILMLYYGGFQ